MLNNESDNLDYDGQILVKDDFWNNTLSHGWLQSVLLTESSMTNNKCLSSFVKCKKTISCLEEQNTYQVIMNNSNNVSQPLYAYVGPL